jgi:hypothetical protein
MIAGGHRRAVIDQFGSDLQFVMRNFVGAQARSK